jgi:hypothetical protein
MTFRFATECQMTLCGSSYEEIYLKFKDFQHGDLSVQEEALTKVCPPENTQMYFSVDSGKTLYEIASFKGCFSNDISENYTGKPLVSLPVMEPKINMLSEAVRERIADVYW